MVLLLVLLLGVVIVAAAVPGSFHDRYNWPYATVGWFTGFANIEQLDREEQAVYADPDFLKLIDGPGSTAYTSDPAASSQVIYRRIP